MNISVVDRAGYNNKSLLYSATRTVTRQQPVIEKQAEDKFEVVLFLPEGESRQGEGGLRKQD